MALIYKRPSDLVRLYTSPGLNTMAGPVPMNQYMSGSISNGGSETAKSFYANTRAGLLRVGVKDEEVDVLLKGQGSPNAMLKVMNYIIANKQSLKFKLDVQHREGTQKENLLTDYSGSFYNRYFGDGSTDLLALKKMVSDKIFGVDCVGFVANWMIYAGVWDKYYGYNINTWSRIFTDRVKSYDNIGDMCILVWGNAHIAIIDSVLDRFDESRGAKVVLCQSSTGGPRKDTVILMEKANQDGGVMFDVAGDVPVKGHVSIWHKPDVAYARPVSARPDGIDLASPMGRWEVRVGQWVWIYEFAAGGTVTWQARDNDSTTGSGTWTMKEDMGQMTTSWVKSTTTETWDLPLRGEGSTGRCRMKDKLYDLRAVRVP